MQLRPAPSLETDFCSAKRRATSRAFGLALLSSSLALACGGSEAAPTPPGAGGASHPATAGAAGSSIAGAPSGRAGASSSGGAGLPASGGASTLTCSEAAAPYTLKLTELDPSVVPRAAAQGFNAGLSATVPLAVDAVTGQVFVGLTRAGSAGEASTWIVPTEGSATAPLIEIPSATVGGIAVTKDGFGALIFDPNEKVDARTWAAVQRFDAAGKQTFATDLFRSSNLTDANTKGAPSTSRLVYSPTSDNLVAYFGHTEMIQAVRHQGGYVATLDSGGKQTVVSDWWGSHNLDQRALVAGEQVGLLGLGDAFPKGIFFSFSGQRPQTHVLYTLAGNGQGSTNGQLGGMVELDDALAIPFITNDSISQTLTPGDWPDIDQDIAGQISDAAANGNKLGLLLVSKTEALPKADLVPVWLDTTLASTAHLERLKAAPYGAGNMILLAWAEVSGSGRNAARQYFTMVVDRAGAVCQPKTPLPAANAFTAGDDIVRRPDGSLVWASVVNDRISVTTLTPG